MRKYLQSIPHTCCSQLHGTILCFKDKKIHPFAKKRKNEDRESTTLSPPVVHNLNLQSPSAKSSLRGAPWPDPGGTVCYYLKIKE